MTVISLILISSLFSLALYNFSMEDEPLHFLRRWLDVIGMKPERGALTSYGHDHDHVTHESERKIFNPVLYCAICMGWFYFTLIFAGFNTFVDCWQWIDIFWWITCAPATSFLNWWLQETLAKALN